MKRAWRVSKRDWVGKQEGLGEQARVLSWIPGPWSLASAFPWSLVPAPWSQLSHGPWSLPPGLSCPMVPGPWPLASAVPCSRAA